MDNNLSTNVPKYLSPQELALMLGVDITTVYGWTCKRKIPFLKIGRLVRFEGLKINLWLKQKSIPCIEDLT